MEDNFQMRLNSDRLKLLEEVEDRILPRIDKTSRTGAVEICLKMGLKYLDQLEEKEEQIQKEKSEYSVSFKNSRIDLQT